MTSKIKTIVCGSTFGQFYIDALMKYSEFFEIAGLYARGSERSIELAKRYGIPLFTSIKGIPNEITLACVVIRSEGVGGDGCKLAIQLMERGIHVIQEQPVYPENVVECYKVARKYRVIYNIGNLYIKLPEVQHFINVSKKLNNLNSVQYISLCFCTQVAFPAIAILAEAISGFHEWNGLSVIKNNGPFDIITGMAGKVPMTIQFNNQINPKMPDDLMYVLHRFSVFFQSGILTLEDTFGPVSWRPRIFVEKYGVAERDEEKLNEPAFALVNEYREKQLKEIFRNEWTGAIGLQLLEMKNQIENSRLDTNRAQKDLMVSKLWTELYRATGYANLIDDIDYIYIPTKKIRTTY